jgi:phenylacetate-CoA ligase
MSSFYSQVYTSWLRLRARLSNDPAFDILKQIEQEERLPIDQLQQLQLQRLNTLLEQAKAKSAFHKQRLPNERLTAFSQIASLPLLTREDIQQHSERIRCETGRPTFSNATGGSTGNPVNFYQDSQYKAWADALEFLYLSWLHVGVGDKTAAFWGADRDFAEQSFRERMKIKLKRVRPLNSFNVTHERLATYLRMLSNWKPTYIIGYASSLHLAAEALLKETNIQIRPIAIRASAEMLYDHQRQAIEQAFATKVYNFYGSREVSHLAAECPAHQGMHTFASGRIVEIVNEQGVPVQPGELGYIVVTDLTNFAFPFIRYRIGDMAVLRSGVCSCGRTWPVLEKITGRSTDIITINGKFIHGEFFTHLFYGRPEVKQFQVVQEQGDRLVVRIVTDLERLDTMPLETMMRTQVGQQARIDFEFVDSIPALKSGKYRFTVNNTR